MSASVVAMRCPFEAIHFVFKRSPGKAQRQNAGSPKGVENLFRKAKFFCREMSCFCRELFFWPGIVKITGDTGVEVKGCSRNAMEGVFEFSGGWEAFRKWDCVLAQSYPCVEEDGFIDEILEEERTVEMGTGFEKDAEDLPFCEFCQDSGEGKVASGIGDDLNLDALLRERFDLIWGGSGAGEDEEVTIAGVDEL